MSNLTIEEYDELFELTRLWFANNSLEKTISLEKEMSRLLDCTPKNAIRELNGRYPEIYQQLTRPVKEQLAQVYPQWFPEYVK